MRDPTFLVPSDASIWVQRVEAGVRAFEAVLGVRLANAHSGTKFKATTKEVPDLARYLKSRLKTKSRWFSLFHGRGVQSTDGGFKNLGYYTVGGSMYAGLPLCRVMSFYPDISEQKHEELLVSMGDAFGAYSAAYSPLDVWNRYRLAHWAFGLSGDSLYIEELTDRTKAEEQLPLIRDCTYMGLENVLQPHHFSWINYWSAEVCEYVGFPQNLAGSPIMDLCYRTPRGAWLVKLSQHPLEPRNEGHAHLLREMYERFSRVGVRGSRDKAHVFLRPNLSLPKGGSS